MKIYFAASISGGREYANIYPLIVDELKKYGEVLSEHFADPAINAKTGTGSDKKAIHDQDVGWVKEADVVVAEVTNPSLGVGYELGKASEWSKRVLCLFNETSSRRLSGMIEGCEDFVTEYYSYPKQIPKILEDFFND